MWSERERILRRLPAPIFVLRCIGAGIVGACVALAVGFILIGIISIAIYDLEQADDAVNGVIGVLWMAFGVLGFVFPIVALRRSRRRPPKPTRAEADEDLPGLPSAPAQTVASPAGHAQSGFLRPELNDFGTRSSQGSVSLRDGTLDALEERFARIYPLSITARFTLQALITFAVFAIAAVFLLIVVELTLLAMGMPSSSRLNLEIARLLGGIPGLLIGMAVANSFLLLLHPISRMWKPAAAAWLVAAMAVLYINVPRL